MQWGRRDVSFGYSTGMFRLFGFGLSMPAVEVYPVEARTAAILETKSAVS